MMLDHWHTEDNPCLLFGVPVTPEAWVGGLIEWDGRWFEALEAWESGSKWWITTDVNPDDEQKTCVPLDESAPIFPPPGFAGKTDAGLWAEIAGGDKLYAGECGRYSIFLQPDGAIWEMGQFGGIRITEYAALILALQNALVLQRRLAAGGPQTR
jgi:hypothetical protein